MTPFMYLRLILLETGLVERMVHEKEYHKNRSVFCWSMI
jgi:hypothetical protein